MTLIDIEEGTYVFDRAISAKHKQLRYHRG
jgi:hypothetical protein